jgi:AraC family transcriptional regulator of arabinose operon
MSDEWSETNLIDMTPYENIVPDCFLFVDRRCFPGWEIIRQKIDFHDLSFIVDGKGSYFVNDREYKVKAGDTIYIPPGSIREAYSSQSEPLHTYAFNFYLLPDNDVRLPFAVVTEHNITNEILQYIRDFNYIWLGKPPGYRMQVKSILLALLHRLLTLTLYRIPGVGYDPRVEQVKAYIIDHFSDDIELTTAAELVGLHPVYLSRLFKKHTRMTFRQFLNTVRINHAEMMLSSGGFTVSEVAERCGFKDIGYFSNVFKAIKGFPPSAILKKI